MDVVMLVIGILGLVAAAAAARFAYPSYREYRDRPDLTLFVEAGATSTSGNTRNLSMHAFLVNEGKGAAVDWQARIATDSKKVRLHRGKPVQPGCSERGTTESWSIEWQATGADDTIGPGLRRDVMLKSDDFEADETVIARYAIAARGMEPRHGEVRISFPAGAAAPTIDVK